MAHSARTYTVWLNSIDGIGPRRHQDLCACFGDAQAVFEQGSTDALMQAGIAQKLATAIQANRNERTLATIQNRLEQTDARAVLLEDAEYPALLREIPMPPQVLYVRGTLPDNDEMIAMVGTRRTTRYGRETAYALAKELAACGVCIVSGMARGIDSASHQGALDAAGGCTIAVLGCGVDVVYPPENRALYEKICENGAVVSEFFFGQKPVGANFPARNRIISGLSRGVVVVESRVRGGSMITVDFANEQGRDVFAVPGNINVETAAGPNELLREGARIMLSAADVLSFYADWSSALFSQDGSPKAAGVPRGLSFEEESVARLLQEGEMHFDALATALAVDSATLSARLTMMELRNVVESLPGRIYRMVIQR